MAVILILGPSHWREPRQGASTPLLERRRIAKRLARAGHATLLLEDAKGREKDRDLIDTFARMLDEREVTDIVVYHPAGAKMQATLHEILLLAASTGKAPGFRVWLLVHEDAAVLDGFHFTLKERGLGSRYLDAVYRLQPVILPWRSRVQLQAHVSHVAEEAEGPP